MSLEYEAWCVSRPDVLVVSRTSSLLMKLVLGVDDRIVVPEKIGELWRLTWGVSVFAQVDIMGPELAEIPGRWTLSAAMGRRGESFDELLSLIVVAAAATVYGGEVVDESRRLPSRQVDPARLVLMLARSGKRDPGGLLRLSRLATAEDE
ncbi:hypothetical protein ABJI51_07310 [Amycolatopsis sp. NEAU-NG30]|uniref:Uncharacterized protein n=1 Tax=Amycolatopsis melonis TaxID=3156488 RepID=A0ABV0L9B3_9PSEU